MFQHFISLVRRLIEVDCSQGNSLLYFESCFDPIFTRVYFKILVFCRSSKILKKLLGYKLDSSHIFALNMFSDIHRLMNVTEYVHGVCVVFITLATKVYLIGMYFFRRICKSGLLMK